MGYLGQNVAQSQGLINNQKYYACIPLCYVKACKNNGLKKKLHLVHADFTCSRAGGSRRE